MRKITPIMVIGYGIFMAGILAMTAISWLWPDKPSWVNWATTLIMVAASVLLIYLISRDRKANPPA